ncbi:MAG: hypothetical protein LC648_08495 [Novosphingobium sp.]|nr:hypothetical protein [Novosphingobium sp.]
MNARIALAAPALALIFAASPALARESGTSRMAEKMNDPATQRAMAAAVAAASEAMLDIPLEPLVRAAEAMGDRRTARRMRGARLRDVAPEAEDMPRELAHKLPAMMGAMGGMAVAMEEMAPALKAMAKEMGARMSEAMRGGGDTARRDDRDYRDDPSAGPPLDDAPPAAQEEPEQGPYATPVPDGENAPN